MTVAGSAEGVGVTVMLCMPVTEIPPGSRVSDCAVSTCQDKVALLPEMTVA